MTVRDIFELRKQGRIEEAYEAIRPMYAAHKGKYTSICMFWTASDIFKLRLEQGRIDEAILILQALKRMLPYVEDKEGKAIAFIQYASLRLSKATPHQKHSADKSVENTNPVNDNNDDSSGSCNPCSNEPSDMSASASIEENGSLLTDEDLVGHLIVGLDEGISHHGEGVISNRQRVLDYIKANEGCSIPKLTIALTIPAKSVERHIAALVADGLVEHRGGKKTGGYYLVSPINSAQ